MRCFSGLVVSRVWRFDDRFFAAFTIARHWAAHRLWGNINEENDLRFCKARALGRHGDCMASRDFWWGIIGCLAFAGGMTMVRPMCTVAPDTVHLFVKNQVIQKKSTTNCHPLCQGLEKRLPISRMVWQGAYVP